jgi:DNA-binding NtrC family response regulator
MSVSAERKILVVEDNPNMSSLLSDMLEVFAIQSVRATDGHDALSKLETESIGMIITDLRMPKMTGLELLEAVKKRDPHMPVVLISGFSVEHTEDQSLLSRADGFLHKPFRMNDIKGILDQHFVR